MNFLKFLGNLFPFFLDLAEEVYKGDDEQQERIKMARLERAFADEKAKKKFGA